MPEASSDNAPTPPRSLREQKRLRTHAALQDSATRLVLEHGFDSVTVEEICTDVGISPRTFFNYFPSKEVVILGPEPKEVTAESQEWFAGTHAQVQDEPALVQRVMAYMFSLVSGELRSEYFSKEIVARRRQIKERNPLLARTYFAKFHLMHQHTTEQLTEFYQQHPEHRRIAADVSDAREATLLVAVVFAALTNGYRDWQVKDIDHPDKAFDYCLKALEDMTNILR